MCRLVDTNARGLQLGLCCAAVRGAVRALRFSRGVINTSSQHQQLDHIDSEHPVVLAVLVPHGLGAPQRHSTQHLYI